MEDGMALLDRSKSATDLNPLMQFAPEVCAVSARLMANLWGVTEPQLLVVVWARIAQLLRNEAELHRGQPGASPMPSEKLAALSQWPTSPLFTGAERAVLDFTEQFIMDVAGVSGEQRKSLRDHLDPAELGGLVTAIYLLDYGQRTRMAFDRLFPGTRVTSVEHDPPGMSGLPARGLSLQTDMDALLKAIARLNSLDMVTTEVVRLRGARRHNCRICQSTRVPTRPCSTRSTGMRAVTLSSPTRSRCA
jgi:hypothetical protein